MNRNEMIAAVRKEATKVGLTFKQSNTMYNGIKLWKFIDVDSGMTVLSNCTINAAYENFCSGYIASYDRKTSCFNY